MTAELQARAGANADSAPSVTHRPIIGVLAVLLGVNISVLAGRLLQVGLPDLRGAVGVGIDEASWIPTALLASQMFMGPLSIFLGAIFGARKVLFVASYIYMASSLASPLVPDWQWVAAWQIVRGLSSGTFYPLTLGFVTRNLPPKWVTFGLAAYALDILGSNHLAYPLYAFYHEHGSWPWMFWNSVVLSVAMLFCLHKGIPPQPTMPEYEKMRFLDLLYASAGLTFLYIGFDQGERLDWFNSGLINGLFVAGILLLLFAVYSRFKTPNPLLDFRFLKNKNTALIAYILVTYFISLLGTFLLAPKFLIELQSYRPEQAATIAALSGVATLLTAPLAAVAVRFWDPRLLGGIGFFLMSISFFGNSQILSTWHWGNFLPWQMLLAMAEPLALVPILGMFIFTGYRPGHPLSRERSYTTGAFFQTIRLFFSEAGSSVMQRFLLTREHFWRTILAGHVNGGWQTAERLTVLTGAMISNAPGLAVANDRGLALLLGNVLRQSETLSIADGYRIIGCLTVSSVFLIALLDPVFIPGTKHSAND